MDLIEFYRRILPSTGRFCLFGPQKQHEWFDSIEDLVAGTERYALTEPNWYFGTCGFDGAGRRKQEHVISAKALRLDFDAGPTKLAKHGPEKVYATQKEAIAHVVAFTKWSGLKPSLLVDSGEGIHVYYCLDEDFPSMNVWLTCAKMLDRLVRHFGLKADATVTKDSARVLRAIGAVHHTGKVVKLLAAGKDISLVDFAAVFKAHEAELPAEASPARTARVSINDDIQAPVIPIASSVAKAGDKCAYVAHCLREHGKVPYPDWINMLSLFKASAEGDAGAHAWSSGHPDYDEDATQVKLDSLTGKPPKCETVEADFAGCASCEQRGKIITPFSLGKMNDRERAEHRASQADAAAQADELGGDFGGGVDDAAVAAGGFDDAPGIAEGTKSTAPRMSDDFKQVVEAARKIDVTEKLIGMQFIPDVWERPLDMVAYCSNAVFFLGVTKDGKIGLCCNYQKVDKIDGETITSYPFLLLTNTPFVIREFIGNGMCSLLYLEQYPSAKERAAGAKPRWKDAEVEVAKFAEPKKFKEMIFQLGIVARDSARERDAYTMMHRYAQANLAMLRERRNGDAFGQRFGFQFQRDEPVYVQGPYKVGPDGKISRCFLTGSLRGMQSGYEMPFLTSDKLPYFTGDVFADAVLPHAQAHCAAVKQVYGTDAPAVRPFALAWALGIASPYLAFVTSEVPQPGADMPSMGFTLSLYSQGSGIGKSTLQAMIQRAFGDAEKNKAGGDKRSGMSAIALGSNMAARGSLPFFIDEVTNNKPEDVSELIHKISIGKDKARAQRNGQVAEFTGGWTSMATMSSNMSLRQLLIGHRAHSEAEQMRLLEINFDEVDPADLDQDAFRAVYEGEIARTTGALGMLLGRYGAMHWSSLRERAGELRRQVNEQFGLRQSERFYAAVYAATKLTLQVMAEFGMTPIAESMLDEEFARNISTIRGFLRDAIKTPEEYAEDMVREFMPRIIRTETETDLRKTGSKPDLVLNPHVFDQKEVVGRYVGHDRRLYITRTSFDAWVREQKHDANTLLRKWAAAGILKIGPDGKPTWRHKLTQGIAESQGAPLAARVIILDLNKLNVIELGGEPADVVDIQSARKSESKVAPAPGDSAAAQGE